MTAVSIIEARGEVSRVRRWVRAKRDELGGYLAGAAIFVVIAVIGLLAVVQDPSDMHRWIGTEVLGTEQNGVVRYAWHGESYTITVPGHANKAHVPVFFDPAHPANGVPESWASRVIDGLFVLGPLTLAALMIVLGMRRWRTIRGPAVPVPGGYGRGLDPGAVHRLLDERRRHRS
jgi:hypothetical protein